MSKGPLRNVSVTIAGTDLSTHVSSVNIDQSADEVDVTGFQAKAREIKAGIPDSSITLNFWQDYDAGSVDATLSGIFAAPDTAATIVVKSATAAVSATNPSWTMEGILLNYSPLAGGVGEANATEVTFRNAGSSGVVRATA
jgi:hypothetical protein